MHDDSFGAAPPRPSSQANQWPQPDDCWPQAQSGDRHSREHIVPSEETGETDLRHVIADDEARLDHREIRTCIALATEDQLKSVE